MFGACVGRGREGLTQYTFTIGREIEEFQRAAVRHDDVLRHLDDRNADSSCSDDRESEVLDAGKGLSGKAAG